MTNDSKNFKKTRETSKIFPTTEIYINDHLRGKSNFSPFNSQHIKCANCRQTSERENISLMRETVIRGYILTRVNRKVSNSLLSVLCCVCGSLDDRTAKEQRAIWVLRGNIQLLRIKLAISTHIATRQLYSHICPFASSGTFRATILYGPFCKAGPHC